MVVVEMLWLLKEKVRKYTCLSRQDLAEEAEADIFKWLHFICEAGSSTGEVLRKLLNIRELLWNERKSCLCCVCHRSRLHILLPCLSLHEMHNIAKPMVRRKGWGLQQFDSFDIPFRIHCHIVCILGDPLLTSPFVLTRKKLSWQILEDCFPLPVASSSSSLLSWHQHPLHNLLKNFFFFLENVPLFERKDPEAYKVSLNFYFWPLPPPGIINNKAFCFGLDC